MKFDTAITEVAEASGEFKALRDSFKQIRRVVAPSDVESGLAEMREAMERLNIARRRAFAAPEWAFEIARHKIMRGDYTTETAQADVAVSKRRKWELPFGVVGDPLGRKLYLIFAYFRSWLPW